MRYLPLVNGQQDGLLEALEANAEKTRLARLIHSARVVKRYGKLLRNPSDVGDFVRWAGLQQQLHRRR